LSGLFCVDASVAVKWLLREEHTDRAMALLRAAGSERRPIVAPVQFAAEVSSAIHKQVRAGNLTLDEGLARLYRFGRIRVEQISLDGLRERALTIALKANMKWIHDAFYVALAEMLGCELWTADEVLIAALGGAHPNVRSLKTYP
jgi:predicted nucleic acid-binding protein